MGAGAGAARAARERESMRRAEESLRPNMREKLMLLGRRGWVGGSYLYGGERNGSVYVWELDVDMTASGRQTNQCTRARTIRTSTPSPSDPTTLSPPFPTFQTFTKPAHATQVERASKGDRIRV